MSDSTKIPPGNISGPKPLPPSTKMPEEEPNARVVKVPEDLRAIRHARGEVTKIARDAASGETTVTVRTERGDVELRLDKNQPVPREGQQVEVTVQPTPNRPPETATIRPAPEQSQPPRPIRTPVEVEIRPPSTTKPEAAPVSTPPAYDPEAPWPQPGAIIRLQPLTPQDAAEIFTNQFPELVVNSALQEVNFQAQIIAADAEENIIKQTLNTITAPVEAAVKILRDIIAPASQRGPQESVTITIPLPAAPGSTTPVAIQTQLPGATTIPPSPVTVPVIPSTAPQRPQAIDVKIENILPPEPALIAPGDTKPQLPALLQMLKESPELQNHKAGVVTGMITAVTVEKLPVLTIFPPIVPTEQSYVLQLPAETLIPGTQIQFTPQTPSGIMPPIAAPSAFPPISSLLSPQPWPAMEDVYQALHAVSPQAAQAFSRIVPNPANPAQVSPAALFFIAAIRAGDITGWLGDKAIDALRRDGRGNALSRLTGESNQISRLAAEPVSQEWRAIPLPMFWQGEIHKLALYYKHDQHGGDKDNPQGKQTRFIFDLNLSNMGKVQVDGLFRVNRLDLIVRTESMFSKAVQQDMRRAYTKALGNTELHGDLSFQNNPEQWVTIAAAQERFGTSA